MDIEVLLVKIAGRLAKNQGELELFKSLERDGKVFKGRELGRGSFATVSEVQIDGRTYVIREEILKNPTAVALAQNARLMSYIQNEFAKLHPDAGFVKTHLSFVDYASNKFTTIAEIRR